MPRKKKKIVKIGLWERFRIAWSFFCDAFKYPDTYKQED